MIHLGVQYYRPPFPNVRYWEDDLKKMAESGLNTIQLWVVWAWVEAEPGKFKFDDYDRLVELAETNGLEVVLSTIAAIHPYWIHRVVPGSEMVDNFGHKVVSSNRGECHFGLTPGGCIDHPGVWERMKGFLSAVVEQYRGASNLAGWDVWNELRWNVQADGLVCYCPYTLNSFRAWLDDKYGGLEGMNEAWVRRYTSWDDVLPGKQPNRPYTEMMAFQDFITWRSVAHAYARYDHVKALDPDHPVTVHGGQPTVLHGYDSYPHSTALHRGNDWCFADHIDGVGCSSFPLWGGREIPRADFVSRIDFLTSAAKDKRIWLSELQGGRSNIGFRVAQSVDPVSQQNWIWMGLGSGADTILFWCWRDEVFGRETTGFGLAGNDGLAEERLAAMCKTGEVLTQYGNLLHDFEPTPAEVGVFFSPQSYYLYWAEEGMAQKPLNDIRGYARALVRNNVPYCIIEEHHLDRLEGLKILFLPRVVVMDDAVAEALAAFVKNGGVLVCESEVGAFGSNGLYRYPEDRYFTSLTGVQEIGRRQLEGGTLSVPYADVAYTVPAAQWVTPMLQGGASESESTPWVTSALGEGRIIFCGSYLGDAYLERPVDEFESLLLALIRDAGVRLPVEVTSLPTEKLAASSSNTGHSFVHVKVGRSQARTLAFVFATRPEETVQLTFPEGTLGDEARDILNDRALKLKRSGGKETVVLGPTPWGISVVWG